MMNHQTSDQNKGQAEMKDAAMGTEENVMQAGQNQSSSGVLSEPLSEADGQNWWLSLDQYEGNFEFAKKAENEFLTSPLQSEDGKDGFARREFLKLMGASIAMATTACIRRPVQKIIPYAQAPVGYTPGIPNFYASTWFDGLEGSGLLVKTMDGRPIKLEGNPLHPMNLGALSARAHAEVLSLYDPDRLKGPVRNLTNKNRSNKETIGAKWEDLDGKVVEELKKGSVALLTSTLPSVSSRAVVGDFQKTFGGARWVQYDAIPVDAVSEGQRLSYGHSVIPRYRFDLAQFVVTIEADILGTHISPTEFMRQWSKRRKPGANMGRLVCFESSMTLTGMNSDDRVRIRPSQQLDVVFGLINAVAKASKGGASIPSGAASFLKEYDSVAGRLGISAEQFAKIGEELWMNRGKSAVIAGGLATATSVEVQVAVNLLNSILGNDGKTIDHDGAPFQTRQGSTADLAKLIGEMQAGTIKTLIIHNLNAAYVLPKDSGFIESLSKVPFVIYTGNMNDETGKYANYVLPNGSTLESWGDYELQSGLVSIQQPTIRPLNDSRSFEESLLVWAHAMPSAPSRAKAKDWFEYLRTVWKTDVYPKANEGKGKSFEDFWQLVLQNGAVELGSRRDRTGSSRGFSGTVAKPVAKPAASLATGYELVVYPTVQFGDGRYANVPWLQELPDPVTKIVWDNYAMVSPAMARKEALSQGDMIEITVGKKTMVIPVHIQPGVHDQVIAIPVGYGRTDGGKVSKNIGVNAFELAMFPAALAAGSTKAGPAIFSGQAVAFKKTGERYRLVSTQDHHSMEGRQIVVETTNKAFQANPESGIHRHKVFSIWPEHKYSSHRWAMSIDLNSCTGCSACVVACQSENNIPVVGKTYVMQGREMHWIRIDRYFKGTPENPDSVFMPLTCMHCETAPCETVCPVLATVHNDEGLNDMVYNRCVGTRYCSNNCPYKVRRFNWFNFSKREAPLHMALNPDVTVRERGVMEKCTLCVHRIRAVTSGIGQPIKPTKIKDGEIKTACQQTCPTDAITFGDLNDPESAVAKLFQEKRTYALLEDLNTQPRVRYMSRVRNSERVVAGHGHGAAPAHGEGGGKEEHKDSHEKQKGGESHGHGSTRSNSEGAHT